MRNFIRRYGIILPLLIVVIGVAAGLTYLSGTLSILPGGRQVATTQVVITALPPLPGTPVARFAQVDRAIVDYLDNRQPSYGVIPLDALGADVQPVGAYLPRTGNMQFELPNPTQQPTPLPYPTAPPLPNPPVPEQILPLPENWQNGVPRVLPYAGEGCAPSGNPAEGVLTQRYHLYHGGIDLGVPLGTPVLATHSGQITFAGWSEVGYGYLVIVQNGSFQTYYAHNTSFNVTKGQYVGKGSIIAWSGSTGNSSGPHIHYEIRINDITVDPLTFASRGYTSC